MIFSDSSFISLLRSLENNKLLSDFVYSYIQKIGKIYLQHSEEKNWSPVVTPLGSHKTNQNIIQYHVSIVS